MGFLSALGDFIDGMNEVIGSDDYACLVPVLKKIGDKKSYTLDSVKNMVDDRGRIAFTIKKSIRDDDIDLNDLAMEEKTLLVTILRNVEKDEGKFITPGYSLDEWKKKAKTEGGLPSDGILTRDKIINMSKKW